MLKIDALDARHGDALVVSWTGSDGPHVALVDGGPANAWRATVSKHLSSLLDEIGTSTIDLVVVSHIDDDHIGGILRLLYEIADARRGEFVEPYSIRRLWHNSLADLVTGEQVISAATEDLMTSATQDVSSAIAQSVAQGRELRDQASYLHLSGNAPFGEIVRSGQTTDVDGLNVVVVGPEAPQLAKQWAKWQYIVARKNAGAVAAAFSDPNVFNQASIVILVDYSGHRMLLTGDARGDHLLRSLRELGYIGASGGLHLDVLKVPHHGSVKNVTREFFELVTADHYIISASGKHGHPSRDVLRWIVEARSPSFFTLHFTNHVKEPYDIVAFVNGLGGGSAFGVNVRDATAPCVSIRLA